MIVFKQYEIEKAKIKKLAMTAEEYEEAIKVLVEELGV
jgi:hypothetical protein